MTGPVWMTEDQAPFTGKDLHFDPLLGPIAGSRYISSLVDPWDLVSVFLPDDILAKICMYTNAYAAETWTRKSKGSHMRKWTPLDVPELKIFLSLCMYMGLSRKGVTAEYWSKKFMKGDKDVQKIMSRDRFRDILSKLHVCDHTDVSKQRCLPDGSVNPNHDPLYKVRELIDHCSAMFRESYMPGQFTSIDEMMIPMKNRIGIKQYIKGKPTKWGLIVILPLGTSGSSVLM